MGSEDEERGETGPEWSTGTRSSDVTDGRGAVRPTSGSRVSFLSFPPKGRKYQMDDEYPVVLFPSSTVPSLTSCLAYLSVSDFPKKTKMFI